MFLIQTALISFLKRHLRLYDLQESKKGTGKLQFRAAVSCMLLLITTISPVSGADTLILRNDTREIPITRKFVDYFEDRSAELTIKNVAGKAGEKYNFRESNVSDLLNTNRASAYWLRFTILDSTINKGDFLIEIFDFDVDEVSFFYPDEAGRFTERTAGFTYPFNTRQVDHKNISFPVSLEKRGPVTLYMRFKSRQLNVLEPIIRCNEKFIDYSLDEYIVSGIFYGIMILIIFYNLVYCVTLRQKYYFFYAFYGLAILFLLMGLNGTGFQYIWYNFPAINPYIPATCLGIGIISMLKFFVDFFRLRSGFPRIYKIILLMIAIRIIYLFVEIYNPTNHYLHIIDLLYIQIIFFAGTRLYKAGVTSTRWFIIAYSIVNVFCIVTFLEHNAVIPSNILTVYSIYIGVTLQFVFMSVGMAESVRNVYKEKNKAQAEVIEQYIQNEILKEKVNRELEEKVRERTNELEKAKLEIEKRAEENLQMNIALDIANNKLQKYITTFAQNVVMNTHVDFDAFKKAYPDDLACMRYLSELKEKNGFACKMCGNTKSIKGKAKFDIRCSKCSYNESITANTIFHKTKFSLQKAFYLLYLVSQTKTDIPATELSRILELQKSTCQNFKNKIMEKMTYIRKGNKSNMVNWELLILDKEVLV
jgi:two-component system, sensor histidine kinase LadS